ncbi:MAG TPA: SCO family protein [Lacunisphaera sp.]|nr:SCO family protein [Lacunisphaera sp.]HVZ66624.1 SCO family protein [Lacunisphaera sp.]
MNITNASINGRGACPQAPSFTRRAVGGNGPYLIAALFALGISSAALGAETPANQAAEPACPHCTAAAAKKADACCAAPTEAATATPFSRESIYQLDGRFTDDQGRPFALGELRGRPVVLDMFFASCGYACPLTVTDMLAIQGRLPAALRGQARFVLVSFDPGRDTAAALAKYREQRGLDGQWVLLRGDDDSVRELAALLGVKYKRDADGSFSHSNLLTILNAAGEVVHQRVGLQGGLDEAAAALAKVTLAAP